MRKFLLITGIILAVGIALQIFINPSEAPDKYQNESVLQTTNTHNKIEENVDSSQTSTSINSQFQNESNFVEPDNNIGNDLSTDVALLEKPKQIKNVNDKYIDEGLAELNPLAKQTEPNTS